VPIALPDVEALFSRFIARTMRLPRAIDMNVAVERDVATPMPDGVVLLADIYTPAGAGPHPTILVRTPYGRRGGLGIVLGRVYAERAYRVVMQSTRGTFGSGGVFTPFFDDRDDGLATVRWIEQQPWFDGRLAMNGPSYMGGVQWAIADSAGPSLKALCTHVAFSDITQLWFPGESFGLDDAIDWTTMVATQETARFATLKMMTGARERELDRVTTTLPVADLDIRVNGAPAPVWRTIVEHPSRADPYWEPIDHTKRVAAVEIPVLQVAGWYDIFLPGQLDDYHALVAAGNQPRLVIGPWTHTASKGFAAQTTESLRWLDRHVRGTLPADAPDDARPVRLFVMGPNEWRDVASWPPPGHEPQRWHLQPGGGLDQAEPAASAPDAYSYDPTDPTPIVGGALLRRSGGRRNQARTEARTDVLVYTSSVLTRDVEVIGDVSAEIHVASDVEHFDVFVRLCEVDEKGRSFNVCDGVQRVAPESLPRPAEGVWSVRVNLAPTAQRFLAGNRIRVQVSSGAHPRYIRNLGTGEPIATGTTMHIAHQHVHHDPRYPSAIVLPVSTS
jgi:putative CocE/NonD family hydrolase